MFYEYIFTGQCNVLLVLEWGGRGSGVNRSSGYPEVGSKTLTAAARTGLDSKKSWV